MQKDQLRSHEERVAAVEMELQQHRSTAPEKGAKSRIISEYLEKEAFLEYEVCTVHLLFSIYT